MGRDHRHQSDRGVPHHPPRAARRCARKQWGRIINTASAHSLVASPNKSAYVAAKHGIAGLTKTVALEAARDGVTVNCISPGYVWTTLVENQIPDTMKARGLTREQVMNDVLLAAQPTKRFVTPGGSRRAGRLPVPRRGRLDHRRQPQHGRRLDRAIAAPPVETGIIVGRRRPPFQSRRASIRSMTHSLCVE